MLTTNKQIAIVGGGPGGLTLARLLQLKGADVKVYERDFDENARLVGSPLDMHEGSGLDALREAGLMEAFRKSFRPGADRKLVMNEKGEVCFSDHDNKQEEDFGNAYFRPEIDRAPLRALLLASLQPGTVVWDRHFLSMEKKGQGWLLHFRNGTQAYADIVVAGDGANSKIRPYLTSIKPFYSGITMLEINIQHAPQATPRFDTLMKGGKIMAFGEGKCLLGGQKGNGDIGFYASFRTDEGWSKNNGLDYNNRSQMLDWFKKEYAGWNPFWQELFANATPPFIPRPIYCMPLDQHWEALPNLTMIGDAAHVMPPFAGEGANMAMLDALKLSKALTAPEHENLQKAISFYETGMRKRAAVAAKDSLDNGELMHAGNALEMLVKMFESH